MIINKFTSPSNKQILVEFLLKNVSLNLYHIGDLDPFFFPRTEWFCSLTKDRIEEVVLVYKGGAATTVLSFVSNSIEQNAMLLDSVAHDLPDQFYSHLSCGVADNLNRIKVKEFYGTHFKMKLKNELLPSGIESDGIRRLGEADLNDLKRLYKESYPENFFDNRMLETGKYFGSFENDKLTGASGIHVYSPEMKVAALGNIVIGKEYRGKGLCKALVTTLCRDLLKTVDVIGLNVHEKNTSAIKCYERCGFEVVGKYDEFLMEVV